MSRAERMTERLHEPLSRGPGPVLRSLMKAFSRGPDALDLGAAQQALYLDSARAEWLSEWADLYGYDREGQTDAELLARMQAETILERRKTTLDAITRAIARALGASPTVRSGDARSYRFDDLEALGEGGYAYDYTDLDGQGGEVGDHAPDSHAGIRAAMPLGPGWGPGGLWITLPLRWTQEREDALLAVLSRHLKAGGGFEVGWAVDVRKTVADQVGAASAAQHPERGWGIEPWGGSTWG